MQELVGRFVRATAPASWRTLGTSDLGPTRPADADVIGLLIHRKAESRTLPSVARAVQEFAWRDAARRQSEPRSPPSSRLPSVRVSECKMTNNRALSRAGCRLTLSAFFALGLAAAAPIAQAQSEPDKPAAASQPGAADSKPGPADSKSSVTEVVVDAPPPQVFGVPPAKAAALAAEAAKNEAWRKYRDSMPPLTRDPNDLAKDFPGLQSYAPQ